MRNPAEADRSLGARTLFIRSIVAAVLLCAVGGCAEYRLRIADSDPTEIQYEEVTMHAYLWGTQLSPPAQEAKCGEDGINDVVIVDNLGYDFVSVLTLGIWKPITLRYRCLAPNGSTSNTLPE